MTPKRQIHLAAHFPGVNNTTVWSDPRSGSHIEFASFVHLGPNRGAGQVRFLLPGRGTAAASGAGRRDLRPRDVVGRPRHLQVPSSPLWRRSPDRLGLAGTINSTFNEPFEVARQFASLDHLSGGRGAWNVVTSWDAFTGENFRRAGFLPQEQRYSRARQFMLTTWELFDSWRGEEIVADKDSGVFLSDPGVGAFEHSDEHFEISGRFNVPRGPQGRPVAYSRPGDSDEGREFAAETADAIFTRHSGYNSGRAFYADIKSRLARYGRDPDELVVLPPADHLRPRGD